jgi:hypothetical protein
MKLDQLQLEKENGTFDFLFAASWRSACLIVNISLHLNNHLLFQVT